MDVAGTVSGLPPWGVKAHGTGPQNKNVISLAVRMETPIPLILRANRLPNSFGETKTAPIFIL